MYSNNPNLLGEYDVLNWTKEQLVEYKRCKEDIFYFIENYVKIVTLDSQSVVLFKLYDYEREAIQSVLKNRLNIWKFPRQSGKTQTTTAILLWSVLFNENYTVGVLAHKEDQAHEILDRVKKSYELLPLWLQQGVKRWNVGDIEIANGSKIITDATSSGGLRGRTINFLYADEFAHIPNHIQEAFYQAIYPTITSGASTKFLITSTPNGLNLFYKLWHDSQEKKNSWISYEVHWFNVPGRDQAWKEEYIRNTSQRQFDIEQECEFLGSSNTLIDGPYLRRLTWISPVHETEHLKIYELPQKDHIYIMTVDTSRGVGLDFHAFVVFDVTNFPHRIVCVFHDNYMPALVYPSIIAEVGRKYNEAFVLVETNDLGEQTVNLLRGEHEYENVLGTMQNGGHGFKLCAYSAIGGFRYGVRTTVSVKATGCSNLKSLIENQKLIINDINFLYELSRFSIKETASKKGNTYEAEEGNDDIVMCGVLYAWLANQTYFKTLTDLDVRKSILDSNQHKIWENLVPFGFISDGSEEVDTRELARGPIIVKLQQNSWMMSDNEEYEISAKW